MGARNSNLIKQFSSLGKYCALFLPGLPGEYRERPLVDDLKKLEFDIYSIVYPGTYEASGKLSPGSIDDCIGEAIEQLNCTKLPTLIITYSFSTYFILKHLKKVRNLMGVVLFSPILDLKNSIKSDFVAEIEALSKQNGFSIDTISFNHLLQQETASYEKLLGQAANCEKPLIFVVGEKDEVINREFVLDKLDSYRNKISLNQLSVIKILDGSHKLDSLYSDNIVYKFLVAMTFSQEIARLVPHASLFFWGASYNYRYSNPKSDVDIAILGEKFSYTKYAELNRLVNDYAKKVDISLDIIINTYEELQTLDRIRSNRGPSFIHELDYCYLPTTKDPLLQLPKIAKRIIQEDAVFANALNFYKSKKALLNYPPGSSSSNWIVKDFIIGCYYYQYLIGNMNIDQNNIDSYFDEQGDAYKVLMMCKQFKNNQMVGIKLEDLKLIVETKEKMFSGIHER